MTHLHPQGGEVWGEPSRLAPEATPYKRQATPMERLMTRSPFATVTMVARIRGAVPPQTLANAVERARLRHPLLRVRIVDDDQHNPWFTSDGAAPIPIHVTPRDTDGQWKALVREAGKSAFKFDEGPPIRFCLLHSPDVSDLVIICHHILCDGLSLAYLARDILAYLGNPDAELADQGGPTPLTPESMPEGVSLNPLVRFFVRRINRQWEESPVFFDQSDYEALSEAYWRSYEHRLTSIELSSDKTEELAIRCRREGVTVNTALVAAYARAQKNVLGNRHHPKLAIAGDLRGRMNPQAGEAVGFYASAVTHEFEVDGRLGFWDSARRLQRRLTNRYTDKALFKDPLTWSFLNPTILEAINFKKIGRLVEGDSPRMRKLRAFSERDDVVLRILRRDGLDSLDQVAIGTAMTNLTRLDFPSKYGALELERLIMKPGGAFPLANVNILVGAVTAAGRLSLTTEFIEDNVASEEMEAINEQVLACFSGD